DHPRVAQVLNSLAALYSYQGDHARAKTFYERAVRIWETSLGRGHPDLAVPLANLASEYKDGGDYALAEANCKRALSIGESTRGEDHPDLAFILSIFEAVSWAQGRAADALPMM